MQVLVFCGAADGMRDLSFSGLQTADLALCWGGIRRGACVLVRGVYVGVRVRWSGRDRVLSSVVAGGGKETGPRRSPYRQKTTMPRFHVHPLTRRSANRYSP